MTRSLMPNGSSRRAVRSGLTRGLRLTRGAAAGNAVIGSTSNTGWSHGAGGGNDTRRPQLLRQDVVDLTLSFYDSWYSAVNASCDIFSGVGRWRVGVAHLSHLGYNGVPL